MRKVQSQSKPRPSQFQRVANLISTNLEDLLAIVGELNKRAKIHGINHFVNKKYHPLERLLWFSLFIAAVFGVFSVGRNQLKRYRANPTVISLERDHLDWEGVIPALTFCYHNRLDPVKAQYLIKRLWDVEHKDNDYSYFLDYVTMVVNTSASTFRTFNKFANDKRFDFLDMTIVSKDVHPTLNAIVSGFDVNFNPQIMEVMTEKGICYSVNAILQASLMGTKSQTKYTNEKLFSCMYRLHQCFMKLEVFDPTIQFAIHSPYEVVTQNSLFVNVGPTDEVENTYNVVETIATANLKILTTTQRKCRFYDDVEFGMAGYNVNSCRLKCRAEAAIKLCGCRPHFYTFINGTSCGPAGLVCLSLNSWPQKVKCDCMVTCSELVYTLNTAKMSNLAVDGELTIIGKKSTIRYEIMPQKVRYRRDVMYSFEDLIVSFGGIASLFLGINFFNISKTFLYIAEVATKYFLQKFYSRNSANAASQSRGN